MDGEREEDEDREWEINNMRRALDCVHQHQIQ